MIYLSLFDFHTAPYPLVFDKEPDYSAILKEVEILNLLTDMSSQSICIIDFYKHNYFYISKNHLFNCGYTYEEAKGLGEKFPELIIYKEDIKNQLNMKDAACTFFSLLSKEDLEKTSIFSTHRLVHKNGNVFSISNQYKPFRFDDKGKMWMAIGISTLSTKNHRIESYIEMRDTNERFIFDPQKQIFTLAHNMSLTVKEQEILALSAQGYTSKDIATEKKVSLNTIKFHKQNILVKLNVQNISEAILYAYSHNLY